MADTFDSNSTYDVTDGPSLNCFGYVLMELGILTQSTAKRLSNPEVLNIFKVVEKIDDADAIGIIHKIHGNLDHIVYIDRKNNCELFHVEIIGYEPSSTNLKELREFYPSDEFDFVYYEVR